MTNSMVRAVFLFGLAVVWPSISGVAADPSSVGPLQLLAPWARATPPTASNGAVFVEIRNTGSESDWLIAAASPAAGMAGIHETRVAAGVMKMRAIEMLEIPAGGSILLMPGGIHIMLMNLAAPLQQGATVSVTLEFKSAGRVELAVPVAALGALAAPHSH